MLSDEIFYREISLPASYYSVVIVNGHDWPTLIFSLSFTRKGIET